MRRGEWDDGLCDAIDAAVTGIGFMVSSGLPSCRKSVGTTRKIRDVVTHVQNDSVTMRGDEFGSGVRVPSKRVTLLHTAAAETQHVDGTCEVKDHDLKQDLQEEVLGIQMRKHRNV